MHQIDRSMIGLHPSQFWSTIKKSLHCSGSYSYVLNIYNVLLILLITNEKNLRYTWNLFDLLSLIFDRGWKKFLIRSLSSTRMFQSIFDVL